MDDLRVASAEVSGVELNPKSSPNSLQIRSFDITPPPELVEQWAHLPADWNTVASLIAKWGADQELDACCEWVDWKWSGIKSRELRASRRLKPQSLKEQALDELHISFDRGYLKEEAADTIRRALEQLPDNKKS
jgi:hypothetical protein